MWDSGQSFVERMLGIVVTIERADEDSSIVTLTNEARDSVFVHGDNTGYADGSSTAPWNMVWEGHGATYPGGSVYIDPGSHTENLKLKRPAVLRRWVSSGIVAMGQ